MDGTTLLNWTAVFLGIVASLYSTYKPSGDYDLGFGVFYIALKFIILIFAILVTTILYLVYPDNLWIRQVIPAAGIACALMAMIKS